MSEEFLRFPHTPHLSWLGEGEPRDDKVLDSAAAAELLSGEVVVEEKVDGQNVGLSIGSDGQVRAQSRGQYLAPGGHPQFGPLWPWIDARADQLRRVGPDRIVFGEWCFARHSVAYDRLPDWFLGFDVFERSAGHFWSSARRNELFKQLGIVPVPELARGPTSEHALISLLEHSTSRLGESPLEGLYIRCESSDWLLARAKLVRSGFLQEIGEHWSQRQLVRNRLSEGAR